MVYQYRLYTYCVSQCVNFYRYITLSPTTNSLSIYFAAITVGYVETAVNVSESDGVAQLTVAISVPPGADPIETLFFLLVNTLDETATGLA